jgi:hypothetical protein
MDNQLRKKASKLLKECAEKFKMSRFAVGDAEIGYMLLYDCDAEYLSIPGEYLDLYNFYNSLENKTLKDLLVKVYGKQ